jgi:hypothetical protein
MHIMIYGALAGEAELTQVALGFKFLFLRFSHGLRLTFKELHAAGGAAGITTTAVQWIPTVILERQHQAGSLLNFKCPNSFDF